MEPRGTRSEAPSPQDVGGMSCSLFKRWALCVTAPPSPDRPGNVEGLAVTCVRTLTDPFLIPLKCTSVKRAVVEGHRLTHREELRRFHFLLRQSC